MFFVLCIALAQLWVSEALMVTITNRTTGDMLWTFSFPHELADYGPQEYQSSSFPVTAALVEGIPVNQCTPSPNQTNIDMLNSIVLFRAGCCHYDDGEQPSPPECWYEQRTILAQAAGAVGVVVGNCGSDGTNSTLWMGAESNDVVNIPTVSVDCSTWEYLHQRLSTYTAIVTISQDGEVNPYEIPVSDNDHSALWLAVFYGSFGGVIVVIIIWAICVAYRLKRPRITQMPLPLPTPAPVLVNVVPILPTSAPVLMNVIPI